MGFTDKPTGELVVLMLTATACLFVLFAGAGLTYLAVARPSEDITGAVAQLEAAVTALVGGIFGYLGGRSVRRRSSDE